jgi:hypothetical protein
VYFKNCKISDYSALKALGSRLVYLYNYDIDDSEFQKLCDGIKDANFPNLEYFAVAGETEKMCTDNEWGGEQRAKGIKYITSLKPLSEVKASAIGTVKYLSLECNEIGNDLDSQGNTKYALENLKNFNNLYLLRIEGNQLTTLKGLEDKNDLTYLIANNNKLGIDEKYLPSVDDTEKSDEELGKNASTDSLSALSNKSQLMCVNLRGNVNLKWVSYLSNDTAIKKLYFGDGTSDTDCVNIIDTEIATIRNILKNCGTNKSYPRKILACDVGYRRY